MTLLPPVRELGDEPAVSVAGAGLTYAELRGAAAAVAAEIQGATRVAVWAESTLETIVAAVAVLESGLALVPINPKLGRSVRHDDVCTQGSCGQPFQGHESLPSRSTLAVET